MTFGNDVNEIVKILAFTNQKNNSQKTLGGKVWWKQIQEKGDCRLQQNLISQHYRILDKHDYRWFNSFDIEEALDQLYKLTGDPEN